MMNEKEIKELVQNYLWIDDGPQKNRRMLSFHRRNSHTRLSIFLNTGTVSIRASMYPSRTYRDIDTIDKLQDVLNIKI